METKNQKFKRLAEARTNQVLDKLKILGNCANRSVYAYTDEEVEKIFGVIERTVLKVRAQFKTPKNKEGSFKL